MLGIAACLDGCRNFEEKETLHTARLEVYEEDGTTLINTVEDEEAVARFEAGGWGQEAGISSDVDPTGKDLEGREPLFTIAAMKEPAALINNGKMEKTFTITVYEGTDVVKMVVMPQIKNIALSEEFLTFYFEVPEEDMEFFLSLAGKCIEDSGLL
jgi:hypothetical protein